MVGLRQPETFAMPMPDGVTDRTWRLADVANRQTLLNTLLATSHCRLMGNLMRHAKGSLKMDKLVLAPQRCFATQAAF